MPFPTNTAKKSRKGGRPRRHCDHAPNFDTEGRCVECRNARLRSKYGKDPATRARKKASAQTYRGNNVAKRLLWNARGRARKDGYPCTITVHDIVIPKFCPLLGIELKLNGGKHNPAGPSIDKIIPELGYVPGNVWVISFRANTLKRDATLEELQMLVKGLVRVLSN